ncbi:glycoside hydrolase family 1 protein [Scleroderma citrinum Foug A]|uniref:beta-glucosidase n=1 Tax=Scleroderma citrinum Foug A TaxID=1036808 RepID=A0A0C3DCN5_9AGAM|nr:glycoside hydrolase family 1 protein [Scleroderma citrinum Foug A]
MIYNLRLVRCMSILACNRRHSQPCLLGSHLRLPVFTAEEIQAITGPSDFYRMNTYTMNLCRAGGTDELQGLVNYMFNRPDGTQLGTQANCSWLQDYPEGFRQLLNYIWNRYKHPIYVTENGFCVKNESSKPMEDVLRDIDHVNYFRGITAALKTAVLDDCVDV